MGELGYLRFCCWGSSPCLAGCVVRLRRSGVALRASAALPGGWTSVAALWGCFDGAKVRFCLKENRFFGILHDEKAADCGGVLQACGREPRVSASLQPGGLANPPRRGCKSWARRCSAPRCGPAHTHRARPRAETGRARRGSCCEGGFSSDRRSGCARGCRGGCARRPAWPRCGGSVGARGRGIGSGF